MTDRDAAQRAITICHQYASEFPRFSAQRNAGIACGIRIHQEMVASDQGAAHAQDANGCVKIDDLIPLFRDAASVNMTEEAVERQARRFAEAITSLYNVRPK